MKVYSYAYNTDYLPAMPFAEVELNRVGDSFTLQKLSVLVDSGADITMIPLKILRQIRAQYIGEARLRGVLERGQYIELYLVQLTLGSHHFRGLRVAAIPGDEAILGRDVLNRLEVTLNGLASMVEIHE